MPYDPIPAYPGAQAVTANNGSMKVWYITLQTMGKIRIQADVVSGTAAIGLELHQFTYPATSFVSRQTYIEMTLPVGTHYVGARSIPGNVTYKIWRKRIVRCPTGCVPASHMTQAIREMAANFHKKAGLPPPTEEDIRSITPQSAIHLIAPRPTPQQFRPRDVRLGPPPRSQRRIPTRPTVKPQVRPIMADGPPVRVVLTAGQNEAQFTTQIGAPGNYEFIVTPPALADQEVFYLSLLSDRGQTIQSSSEGRLVTTLSARTWKASLVVPRSLLRAPKVLNVWLKSVAPVSTREGLDNPPDGDGKLRVGAAVSVDLKHTRAKGQYSFDVQQAGKYRVTCVEVTGGGKTSPHANAPATLTLFDAGGTKVQGPSDPGAQVEADLTPGRWWVDVEVPDFHGRTTPRRYACGVARVATA